MFVVVIGLVVYARTTVVSRAVRHAHLAPSPHRAIAAANAPTSEPAPVPVAVPTTTTPPALAASPGLAVSPPARVPIAAPQVAIIIDDCGQWLETERAFIALPIPLTLAVLPHVHGGAEIASEADAAGKGVMLHLPMETISGRDPGPGAVTTGMTDDAIATTLTDDLATVPHAAGVNNHEGSRATANARVMDAVAGVLAHDNRFFVDSRTSAQSVGETEARAAGVPTARRDVFLDNTDDLTAIETQLLAAASLAHERGRAIAIGHPRANTLAALRAVYPRMQADGVEFTLVATLVH